LLAIHLKGNPKVCFVSVYAPTNNANVYVKDAFYNDLTEFIKTIPPHTITILAGDFNARIGRDSHISNPRVVGNHCYHTVKLQWIEDDQHV